ncbi:MAG: choice-of-anchor B family protein [Planctomycetota bacterium]
MTLRIAALIGALALTLSTGFGHDGDPKALYLQAPYVGPGYRSAVPAAGPPGLQFPSANMSFLAWLPLAELAPNLSNGNDCWGYVSPSGREYAIIGTSHGTTFVEVTNPGNPQVIATIDGGISLWRDIKVYQSYAYSVVEEVAGIQVIDLGNIDNGQVTLVNTINDVGTGRTHNVAIDEVSGFLYRCGGQGNGLRIYDLSNPASPTFVGEWQDRYVHDACIVTYPAGTAFAGQQIAFCCAGLDGGWTQTGLTILDVTDKTNPIELAHLEYSNAVYSHQCWPTPDLQTIYLNDEVDEGDLGTPTTTRIIDISNLSAPVEVGTFGNGSSATDHNLYVKDQYIFEANYRNGLRVFDATNPLAPIEVAFFDTYPTSDASPLNGLWSVYPYFPSGTIIGSDLEKGLFVWRLGDLPLTIDFPGDTTVIPPIAGTVSVEILEQTADPLLAGSVELHYDAGSGEVTIPMTEVSPGVHEGNIPGLACGASVDYYVTAQTASGYVMRAPIGAPAVTITGVVAAETVTTNETFESGLAGWTVGAPFDTATTGIWELGDPIPSDAQLDDDHSDSGVNCWFTGQGLVGGGAGDADVDGGTTTLISPTYDLSNAVEAEIEFWFAYSNDLNGNTDDTLRVEVSSDGAGWALAHEIANSTDGWARCAFLVSDLVPLTSTMQFRVVAGDFDPGSIVEAAIDDVTVRAFECLDCNGNLVPDSVEVLNGIADDCNANGVPDACDLTSGTSNDLDGNDEPDECQCPIFFVRGDVNDDEEVDVADAVTGLGYLFAGAAAPVPLEALDVNNDGDEDVADVVYLLAFLFQSGTPPDAPYPTAGCAD